MPTVQLRVGTREEHTVKVSASPWGGEVDIWLDGKKFPSSAISQSAYWADFSLPTKTFSFGQAERHTIEIEYSGGVLPEVSIYLDGKLMED